MAKRFDIHEWQAKQRLAEQEEFTPDLEDDELKRGAIRQMMDKEKGGKEGPPYISATQLFDNIIKGLETSGPYQDNIMFSKKRALEIIEMAIDIEESEISPEAALDQAMEDNEDKEELNENEENIPELSDEEKDNLHDMVIEFARKLTDLRGGNYSGDKLLAALQHVTLEIENLEPMIYDDEDEDGIPDVVDDELDEQNVTGTGASFNSGEGMGHFGKKKKNVYEEEEEKSMSKDVERLEKLIDNTINTKEEWEDMFQLLMAHSEAVTGLNDAQIKSLLQQSLKEL